MKNLALHAALEPYLDSYGYKWACYQLLNESKVAVATVSFRENKIVDTGHVSEFTNLTVGEFLHEAFAVYLKTKPINYGSLLQTAGKHGYGVNVTYL